MSKSKHRKPSKKDKGHCSQPSKDLKRPSKVVTFRYASPKAKKPSKIVTFRYALPRTTYDEELVEKAFVISLNDPISNKRIMTPVRSRFCSHLECFDLDSFLVMNNLNKVKPKSACTSSLANLKKRMSSLVAAKSLDSDRMQLVISEFQPQIQQIDRNLHNQVTTRFDYKLKLSENRRLGLKNNDLQFFTCPVCGLEFNVYKDLVLVNCLADLLMELDNMNINKKDQIYYKASKVLQNSDLIESVKIMPDASWTFQSRSGSVGKKFKSKNPEVITLDDTFSEDEPPSEFLKEVPLVELKSESGNSWDEEIIIESEQEEDIFFIELTKGTQDDPMVLD